MMKLLTVPEMLAVERASDASGHTYDAMMECAGRSLAELVHKKYKHKSDKKVLALVGKGNNGGDALVALAYMREWGWNADFVLVNREADSLVERAVQAGCSKYVWPGISNEKIGQLVRENKLVMDGLLGTGIRLPLRPPVNAFLSIIGENLPQNIPVVAVDTPSGVDCRTGAAAKETLRADMTVTMAAAKTGLFGFPAADYVGELKMGNIGLSEDLEAWRAIRRWVVDQTHVHRLLPLRPASAHKGTFGTAVICAGSSHYVGAALLAGKAAFRVGAGLVTTACTTDVYNVIAGQFPESTWLPLDGEDGALTAAAAVELLRQMERVNALLIGPGFGLADSTFSFIERLLSQVNMNLPLVVDADGLKHLSRIPEWPGLLPVNTILTPHPGEMSTLTGLSTGEIQEDRLAVVERFAAEWGHTVVLKGAFTLVSSPDGRTGLIPVSTPALARAGTGDVLAGMITGLRAQGLDSFDAALVGAWLHAQAGLSAQARLGSSAGVLAGDILSEIPGIMLY